MTTHRRYAWRVPIHLTPLSSGQHQDGGTELRRSGADQIPAAEGQAAPLLVAAVLEEMKGDFSDPTVVARFARDFCSSLEAKIDRLDLRLQDGDMTATADAALSLTTSAAMVGAVRLGQLALSIQRSITAESFDDAQGALDLLRACGAEPVAELQRTSPE